MRLDIMMVRNGLASSRAHASFLIRSGRVIINNKVAGKASLRISDNDSVNISADNDDTYYVARSFAKLEHALNWFSIKSIGRIALDVGAGTGGFTQVMLRGGVDKVFCVDVGEGQLHPSISSDMRVIDMGGTNIRHLQLDTLSPCPDLIVVDLSFISISKGLENILGYKKFLRHVDMIILIKPQFERDLVGELEVSNKKGIVRDANALDILEKRVMQLIIDSGWEYVGYTPSPIKGKKGNIEFLCYAKYNV